MYIFFALLFFISLLLLPVVLIKPSLIFHNRSLSRKKATSLMVAISVISLILGVYLTPESVKKQSEVEGLKTTAALTPTSTPRPSATPLPSIAQKGQPAYVSKVVDGDTITVDLNGTKHTVRIIGIDTPETVDPRKPVQCFGVAASNRAKELLTNQKVFLEQDPTQGDKDKYNRLLRYVWMDNGKDDYGLSTIADGYAHEYTYQIPYKYQSAYKKAEKDARAQKKGLWADGACSTPTPTRIPSPTKKITSQSPAPQTAATRSTTPVQVTAVTANQSSTSNTGYSGSLAGDKDCKDFATHAQAQSYFLAKGGSPTNNADNLDADHDGIACESLP